MDQASYREVGHHQPVELLSDEIGGLAAKHDLGAAQVGLELVQRGFDFPPLVIEGCQFVGRGFVVIQKGGDEPVDRLSSVCTLYTVVSKPHQITHSPAPPISLY